MMVEVGRFALAMVGHFLASLLYVLRRLRIINAVVDTSSILDHREELKELWEKRMMADENQPSPSSAAVEQLKEEDHEEKVLKTKVESETEQTPKAVNGTAHPLANGINNEIDSKETLVETLTIKESAKIQEKEEHNIADSLEDVNANVYVEEKTYTSELETSLVMKHVTEVVTEAQTIVQMATSDTTYEVITHTEKTTELGDDNSQQSVTVETNTIIPEDKPTSETDSGIVNTTDADVDLNNIKSTEYVIEKDNNVSNDLISIDDSIEVPSEILHKADEQIFAAKDEEPATQNSVAEDGLLKKDVPLSSPEMTLKDIEIDIKSTDDDDGYVRVGECLPQDEETEEQCATEEVLVAPSPEIKSAPVTNGHTSPAITPEPRGEAVRDPEIEQFVKSGGLKRLLVAKTEQPYNSCDTETKIAIEIREMREREEELRVMREHQIASPVPPKSSSPAPKEQPTTPRLTSPVPAPTTGYRVSSVFGTTRAGTTSPGNMFEDERKKNKETAVEREIRQARDREEEIRKQQGLPPREDDSYVKPSQVKSSQVRVFGKAMNNANAVRQAATAKIQMEIEEQTQREMALRDTGSIQTISQERTDAKVAKLKTPDTDTAHITNGNSHPLNGTYSNGRASPCSPSPTGQRPMSLHKFITGKAKETPVQRNGGIVNGGSKVVPSVQLKRTQSVESKIQQEIMEMKEREDELKLRQTNLNENDENGIELEMNMKNSFDYENGNYDEELNPRHNKLIAQWEQRIQKAES